MMGHMPAIPESTRSSIIVRLLDHAELEHRGQVIWDGPVLGQFAVFDA